MSGHVLGVKSIQHFPTIGYLDLVLHPDDLSEIQATAKGQMFTFPVSFAPDLRCISVLRTLYWNDSQGLHQRQRIDPPARVESPQPSSLNTWRESFDAAFENFSLEPNRDFTAELNRDFSKLETPDWSYPTPTPEWTGSYYPSESSFPSDMAYADFSLAPNMDFPRFPDSTPPFFQDADAMWKPIVDDPDSNASDLVVNFGQEAHIEESHNAHDESPDSSGLPASRRAGRHRSRAQRLAKRRGGGGGGGGERSPLYAQPNHTLRTSNAESAQPGADKRTISRKTVRFKEPLSTSESESSSNEADDETTLVETAHSVLDFKAPSSDSSRTSPGTEASLSQPWPSEELSTNSEILSSQLGPVANAVSVEDALDEDHLMNLDAESPHLPLEDDVAPAETPQDDAHVKRSGSSSSAIEMEAQALPSATEKASGQSKGANEAQDLLPHAHYRRTFSPCGQYMMHIERQNDHNLFSEGHWNLTIWEKPSAQPGCARDCRWQDIASMTDIYGDFQQDGRLAFNPRFQIIAMCEGILHSRNITTIWDFRATPRGSRGDWETDQMVYATGLVNIDFSPDGRFLFGDHLHYGEKRIVNVDRFIAEAQPAPSTETDESNDLGAYGAAANNNPQALAKFQANGSGTIGVAAPGSSRPMASSNALTITTQDGVPELQTVRTYADGAVVLKRLSSLIDTEQCLLYLPDKTQGRASATILNNNNADVDNVRIMLTPGVQDTYSLDDPMTRQSARIISRPVRSVQEYSVPRQWRSLAYHPGELANIPSTSGERLQILEEGEMQM